MCVPTEDLKRVKKPFNLFDDLGWARASMKIGGKLRFDCVTEHALSGNDDLAATIRLGRVPTQGPKELKNSSIGGSKPSSAGPAARS